MITVKCVKCLQKHLALCKSFAREVLDGHGEGGDPDHRDDMDGEITNAEMHASMIDEEMQLKIRMLRRQMQARRFRPEASDLDALSVMYHYCDAYSGLEVDDQIRDAFRDLPSAEKVSNVFSADSSQGCGCRK